MFRPILRIASRALLLLILFLAAERAAAQPTTGGDEPRYPGTTGQSFPFDTTVAREMRTQATEASIILERPIDPEKYILGPSDMLGVMIMTSTVAQHDIAVTPDARVVVPRVGDFDVRNQSLADLRRAVTAAAGKYYQSPSVSVTLKKMRQFKISVIGAVKRIGTVVATPTTRVSEAINMAGGASPLASRRDIIVFRDNDTLNVDLVPFYAYGALESDPVVQGGDVIKVGVQDPKNIVVISGAVHRPGEFTFHRGDSISTLIRFSFGFTVDAILDSIEVTSVDDEGNIMQRTFHTASPDGSVVGDRPLRIGDQVFVRRAEKYRQVNRVVVDGEFKYPGYYAIDPGRTRVLDVIRNAGGFTSEAAINDAVLIRRQMVERDLEYARIEQIDPEQRTEEETEYFRVKNRERMGVITIDFNRLNGGDENENVVLRDKDSLYVPQVRGFVKVSGKVKNPGNVTFTPGTDYLAYINLAGGYGWRADDGEEQIIKGKTGEKFLAENTDDYVLESGDAIFVPEEPPSDFWEGFATVIAVTAQLATIFAVVVSVGK